MSIGYQLVNFTNQELILFSHLPVNTMREISGNPVSASIVTWYMLNNTSCELRFVSDTYDDWPFPSGTKKDLHMYKDVTSQVIDNLVKEGILLDSGMAWVDEEEPASVHIRAIYNVWANNAT